MMTYDYSVYHCKAVKVNGHSIIYNCDTTPINTEWVTPSVKIERFQGYSNAKNISDYYRLRNASSWKESKQITGLFSTQTPNVYFGNTGRQNKTLLIFKFANDKHDLSIYVFPPSFYPSSEIINNISKEL